MARANGHLLSRIMGTEWSCKGVVGYYLESCFGALGSNFKYP
jgi:hypothetical protein